MEISSPMTQQEESPSSPSESRKRPRPVQGKHFGQEDVPFLIEWHTQGEEQRGPKLNAVVTFSSQSSNALSLCLMGRAQLRCLQGAVEILGYRLDPSHERMIQVESPPWSSLLVFQPQLRLDDNDGGDDAEDRNSVILQVDSWWPPQSSEHDLEATFELAKSPFPGVRPTCIPPTWAHAMDTVLPQVWPAVPTEKGKEEACILATNATTNNACFRMAICGAKGVGKSTFLRYALNRILTDAVSARNAPSNENKHQQVAILDADVGQPEMSPPGLLTLTVVSAPLLTPPHYRSMAQFPQEQQISYFFGSVTSKNDPHRYMELIQRLVHDYEQEIMPLGIPLLINLDGWVKGLGYELLSTLLTKIIKPTNVVQIVGLTKSKQFDLRNILNSDTSNAELQVIYAYNSSLNNNVSSLAPSSMAVPSSPIQNGESTRITAAKAGDTDNNTNGDKTNGEAAFLSAMTSTTTKVPVSCTMPASALRALRLCTYFLNDVTIWYHLGFGHEGIGDDTCEIAHRLAGALPYVVPFEAVDIQWEGSDHFADLACDSSPHNFDLRLDAINAKLVGLCCRPTTPEGIDDSNWTGEEEPLRCAGLGLVRSIDRDRRTFYILTPVDSERLKDVNVLVGGTVDVPIEFWFRGVHAEAFPYQSYATATTAVGAEPMNSRNNIGRKSLAGK